MKSHWHPPQAPPQPPPFYFPFPRCAHHQLQRCVERYILVHLAHRLDAPGYSIDILGCRELRGVVLHSLTKYVNWNDDVVMSPLSFSLSTPSTQMNQPGLEEKLRFVQNAMVAMSLNTPRALQSIASADLGTDEVVYLEPPGRTAQNKRKRNLAWKVLSPHARRRIADSMYARAEARVFRRASSKAFPVSGITSILQGTYLSLTLNSIGPAESCLPLPIHLGRVP
jgi:hypothetical protein